jgi:hypothetical protein
VDGDVWFKEAAPSLAFEPALTAFLADRRPDLTPDVIAAEGVRLLTRDVGPQVRALEEAGQPAPAWEETVQLYGRLQIELLDEVERLLALGVPDSRPAALGQSLDGPVPPSLVHEEVHDGNVFVRGGRPVFIDWAEAAISHPFAGLVNTLRVFAWRKGLEGGEPEVLRLRDAYLEVWSDFGPQDELRELFTRAYAVGALARAATWERILLPLPPDERDDFEQNIAAWREIHADAVATGRLGA